MVRNDPAGLGLIVSRETAGLLSDYRTRGTERTKACPRNPEFGRPERPPQAEALITANISSADLHDGPDLQGGLTAVDAGSADALSDGDFSQADFWTTGSVNIPKSAFLRHWHCWLDGLSCQFAE